MIPYEPPKPAEAIPVIDLSGSFSADPADHKAVAWEIHRACREAGFFYVANHRVPEALIAAEMAWARRFFDLPLAAKLALSLKKSPTKAGYEPIGGQVLDSQDDTADTAPPDLKESFYCGMELPDGHPWAVKRLRGFGHNQWPAGLPGFREQNVTYWQAMTDLGNRLLSLLALSLDLPPSCFESAFDMPLATLRLIKYPPQPATAELNQIGAGAHTDWGGITLLAQDEIGGLEVRNAAGAWIAAPPIPGTFVINLGDLMARWTNGLYTSNMHRVRNNDAGRDRYSVPFFYSPRPDTVISPLPGCASQAHPQRFKTCRAEEHMAEMFRRSYGYAPTEAAT
ncbi:MAG: isopenicillin N synthase family dioxygenase [Stellaceae bacterium]